MSRQVSTQVIGVDPGETTGVVSMEWFRYHGDEGRAPHLHSDPIAVQVRGPGVPALVWALLRTAPDVAPVIAVEKFVVSGRAARSSSSHAGQLTRALIAELHGIAQSVGGLLIERSAAAVKPWATDARLEAAGLLEATHQMRHARDAARHALFVAVHDGIAVDPLSKEGDR